MADQRKLTRASDALDRAITKADTDAAEVDKDVADAANALDTAERMATKVRERSAAAIAKAQQHLLDVSAEQ